MPGQMGKLIAGALALGVGAFVWSKRMPSIQANDVVAVPLRKLLLPGNQPATPGTGLIPNTLIALQVVSAQGGQVSANAAGLVDPNDSSRYITTDLPIGIGPFGFAESDVVSLWRSGQKLW